MTHLIYDSDRPIYNDSEGHSSSRPRDYDRPRPRGYNRRGFNGSLAFFAIVMLVILLFWIGQSRLRSNLDTQGTIPAMENIVTRPIAENTVTGPILDNRYVITDNINLREEPIDKARVTYILPRGTRVTLLGESHQTTDGEVWLRVNVETFEGILTGWVRQRYVA